MVNRLLITIFLIFTFASLSSAQELDLSFDPFAIENESQNLSIDQMLQKGKLLLYQNAPIDARNTFLEAIKKFPDDHRPYKELGSYYLARAKHFELANEYIQKSWKILLSKYDSVQSLRSSKDFEHYAELTFYRAEVALSLDDYEKALELYEEQALYFWNPSTSSSIAWILFKMERLYEAIEIAEQGLLLGAEPLGTLNVLGILYSVTNNKDCLLYTSDAADICSV